MIREAPVLPVTTIKLPGRTKYNRMALGPTPDSGAARACLERTDGMRHILPFFFILLLLLDSAASSAADCPNVSVHPGITAVFLQTDFGEKDAASKAYVAAF